MQPPVFNTMFHISLTTVVLQVLYGTIYPYCQILLRNMNFSQSVIGVIIACTQLSACVFPILIGNIADKTGKSRFLFSVCPLFVLLCFNLLKINTTPVFVAVVITIAYAFLGSSSSLNDTMINRVVEKHNKTYASVRAKGTMGYVVSLTCFTLLNFPNTDRNDQIILTTTIACLLLFFISLFPQDVQQIKHKTQKKEEFFNPKWFSSSFYILISIIFIKSISSAVIEKLLGSYMTEVLHLGNKFAVYTALGALSEFFFMIIFGKLLKQGKISIWTLLVLSCIGHIARLGLYALSTNLLVFGFAQTLHALTYAASHVASIDFISRKVPKEHSNLAIAVYSAFALTLSQLIGSLGGGFIIDNLGYKALFEIYIIFPAVALIICLSNKKRLV